MKEKIVKALLITGLERDQIDNLIEIPPSPDLGDFAFPCFVLSKNQKKNPAEIAKSIASNIKSKDFEKVESKGPYVNFFVNKREISEETLKKILSEREKYGSSKIGKGKNFVIDMSSPNIAKPFGIGHLRSTIIGNSLAEIASFSGYKPIKINYLGDWGTQFGKLIAGYKRFGSEKKLKENPIHHLLDIYIKVNADESLEDESREWFKKLEDGDKESLRMWKEFRNLSLKEFDKLYALLGINFDVVSGESKYNTQMGNTIKLLKEKSILEESDGAQVVNLDEYGLGVCLIQKSDGATLYATRDITAAIDRHNKYKFSKMIYEVGAEQKLHFRQIFKVLELMGYNWSKDCVHVDHGLYLDKDGKKFATRKGKTIFMEDVLQETISLAKSEIIKREKLSGKNLENRALAIARAAVFYGDLKNYRAHDIIFDIQRFLSFEGDTGPYLLYSYARARSILRKARYKSGKYTLKEINDKEKLLISKLSEFQDVISRSYEQLAPNLIANYSYELSQIFNEFYHSSQVIGSESESFRLALVDAFSIVLKNALHLLGIPVIEKM